MQKKDEKKTGTKKQTYETPKATELGTVRELTQGAVNDCGSNVRIETY